MLQSDTQVETGEAERDWFNSQLRIFAGVILKNCKDEILIVKPSIRNLWNLPGGGAEEEDESPLAAALREVREEVGLTLIAATLVLKVKDYRPPLDGYKDAEYYVFDGGIVSQSQIEGIILQEDEIENAKFVAPHILGGYAGPWTERQILNAYHNTGECVYLKEGYPVA